MGKYLIRVESMDGDEKLSREYQEGIECDGFVIMADKGKSYTTGIHNVNIDDISDMIANSHQVMAAGVLAKAKREAEDMCKSAEMKDMLAKLMGRD